mmetsp:Transcript_28989/g.65689  ORF Transcript_28989/g.65689 Transcript_28989/m.65689 type:complete len:284 (-) Transcript_28989:592-1443(-)
MKGSARVQCSSRPPLWPVMPFQRLSNCSNSFSVRSSSIVWRSRRYIWPMSICSCSLTAIDQESSSFFQNEASCLTFSLARRFTSISACSCPMRAATTPCSFSVVSRAASLSSRFCFLLSSDWCSLTWYFSAATWEVSFSRTRRFSSYSASSICKCVKSSRYTLGSYTCCRMCCLLATRVWLSLISFAPPASSSSISLKSWLMAAWSTALYPPLSRLFGLAPCFSRYFTMRIWSPRLSGASFIITHMSSVEHPSSLVTLIFAPARTSIFIATRCTLRPHQWMGK